MTDPADISAAWRLACRDLSVRRGGRTVVEHVGFELHPGECLSLVGPNGSGKTSLLLALLGLLPPASGCVQLNGVDIRSHSPRARGQFAAYVPQVIESVPAFSVYDVVAGGRYPHVSPLGPLQAPDRAAIRRALEQCGLTALADRSIHAVSGGERQKAFIAAAIAQDAQILFLDEPNTALDPAVQLELLQILRNWHRSGRGLLLISHDLQLPAALGGRVLALRAGRVVAHGPAADVLVAERLNSIYDAPFGVATTPDGQEIVLPRWW